LTKNKSSLPLDGMKVLDLTRVLAGPTCTQILGDLGADVIKIVEPENGDDTRAWGPPHFEKNSAYYLSSNRNKRSRALNLNSPEDLKSLQLLLEKSDVFIENFKTGSLKKFGLDFESLSQKYPRLIYCSITGFGHSGPAASEPGYDVMIQARGGMMSITGPDSKHPTKVGVAVADLSTGLYAVIGILAALRERERSGCGQHIDLALFDVQVAMLANIGMNFLCSGETPEAIGNRHPSIVPYGAYATQDRPIMLSVGNDRQFQNFCEALNSDWSNKPEFKTNEARVKNRTKIESLIEEKLKLKNRDEWLSILHAKKVGCGPIQNLSELSKDPQVLARDLFTRMNDNSTPCIRSPLVLSRTPIKEYRTPPALNQNPSADFSS